MAAMQTQEAAREDAALTFKRFILEESRDFAAEPQADLYRVGLLGEMLDRYDELLAKGMSTEAAQQRVKREYYDIPEQMREQGFETTRSNAAQSYSLWPELTEAEAAKYVQEQNAYLHTQALGTAMCTACVLPLMVCVAFGELVGGWQAVQGMSMLGLVGMFAMIGMGVYSLVTAKKPKKHDTVKQGRFSLSARVREKLMQLQTTVEEKSRRRRGKGIALLAACVAPIFIGAALDSFRSSYYSSAGSILGIAAMFLMIALGVYEIMLADGEKKTIRRLTQKDEK